jgi:Sulfotransferase family
MTFRGGAVRREMKPTPLRSPDSKIRLVYILSASHSGSTLLAMLLNAHPEVCTVGELKATALGDVDHYRCSCRRMISECPFWNRIAEEMAGRGFDFDIANSSTDFRSGASPYVLKLLQPLYRAGALEVIRDVLLLMSPRWRTRLPKIQAMNSALMSAVLSQTKKKVIVDSSKIGIRLKFLIKNPQLDIKIIRLVRNGRAVSLTYMDPANFADSRNVALRGGGSGGDRRSEKLPLDLSAREWRRSNEEAEALLRGVDQSRWMEIRYEELCRDPENTLKKIFAFVGVNQGSVNLDFRSVEHHVVGNGMRLDDSSQIKIDDRWRSHLTESQITAFDSVAGDMNRSLGYR